MKINYPETILRKSEGSTFSEKYLSKLCKQSFLSMWSYPNIFRDQGKKGDGNGDGKEVCDLLVVFENNIIIFSDKDCAFQQGANLDLSWSRWYKKSILQSARQIFGAEKWILDYADRIYLDKACKIKFPIDLPHRSSIIIHRIVVARGISEECRSKLGGSGTLVIRSQPDCVDSDGVYRYRPFTVGKIARQKGFVHVLDDTSIDILMDTLDTITDFIKYLNAKQTLLEGNYLIVAGGEEELLADYMFNVDQNGEHCFSKVESQTTITLFEEGRWLKFQDSIERKNQLELNKISYFWDDLIEKFVAHIFSGTSQYLSSTSIKDHEKGFRVLAKADRFKRRLLANAFLQFVKNVPFNSRATRIAYPIEKNDPTYIFFVFPRRDESEQIYRNARRELLAQYCFIAKLKVPFAQSFVGIATESGDLENRSEDVIVLDLKNWTPDDQIKAKDIENELKKNNLLVDGNFSTSYSYEFPKSSVPPASKLMKGKNRNSTCVCGSGKKFKICCGRFS